VILAVQGFAEENRCKLTIDLSDLEMAFEHAGLEMSYYLDLETGEVVLVTDEAAPSGKTSRRRSSTPTDWSRSRLPTCSNGADCRSG
jgi:hypothetical protein